MDSKTREFSEVLLARSAGAASRLQTLYRSGKASRELLHQRIIQLFNLKQVRLFFVSVLEWAESAGSGGTMHALHPRSKTTSTLFTTTLAVSFLVVALPHLLPCPVDRRQFADSVDNDHEKARTRQKRGQEDVEEKAAQTRESGKHVRSRNECPVPKPGGLVGQVMGFEQKQRPNPIEVEVRRMQSKDSRDESAKT